MLQSQTFYIACVLTAINFVYLIKIRKSTVQRVAQIENVVTTSDFLDSKTSRNIYQCITSCLDHVNCRVISYNNMTGSCVRYSRDFMGQGFSSPAEIGWRHYIVLQDNDIGPINTNSSDCSTVQGEGHTCNGVYIIHPTADISVPVYCDLNTDGGQWTVFQRRIDGSVDFHLNWTDYKLGFGNASKEYWIGNDNLHHLTQSGTHEMLILMESWDGVWKHARFSDFRISDEGDNYRLSLSGYTGTAGDALTRQSGLMFSTMDRDNDNWISGACNDYHHDGGWWFDLCSPSDLNGHYYSSAVIGGRTCHWFFFSFARESLKTVWMMVRKK